MTLQLFHQDSYQQSFEARVALVDHDNHGIILDQTAFYPGGGGQPSDHGWFIINEVKIPLGGIKKVAGEIIHLLPDQYHLPERGSSLQGQLDWDRRYKLMRTHTAMHILCGTIFRDYGASVTGGNMDPLKGRMDFEFATLERELVQSIEDAVNLEIQPVQKDPAAMSCFRPFPDPAYRPHPKLPFLCEPQRCKSRGCRRSKASRVKL